MIGDPHAQPNVIVAVLAMAALAREFGRPVELTGRTWSISYILSTPCLMNATRSGFGRVDVLLRQLTEHGEVQSWSSHRRSGVHKHQVPDLDVAVVIGRRAP